MLALYFIAVPARYPILERYELALEQRRVNKLTPKPSSTLLITPRVTACRLIRMIYENLTRSSLSPPACTVFSTPLDLSVMLPLEFGEVDIACGYKCTRESQCTEKREKSSDSVLSPQ